MRKVICYEGVSQKAFRQRLEPGSIQFPEGEGEKVPLTGFNAYSEEICGWAEDFERDEETGRITANINCIDDDVRTLLENKDAGVTIYCNQVKARHEGRITVVTQAVLRSCFLSIDLPWTEEM